ncbi:MAG: cytochrome c [Gammaproteobacteria bacterium]
MFQRSMFACISILLICMVKANADEQVVDRKFALANVQNANSAKVKAGEKVYKARCALCHGESGQGDGRMSKVIKNPPPFDLTESVMPVEYLQLIVSNGGEPVGRSPQMPPWNDELTDTELESVVLYIHGLRN